MILDAWRNALFASWLQVSTAILTFIPKFLGAVLIFVVGLFVSSLAKSLVEKFLEAVHLEDLSKRSGFKGYLAKAEIKLSATELLSNLVKWVLLLIFFIAAVEVLGLTIVSTVLTRLLGYIPNVLAAALIFGVGIAIANLADGLVRGAFATIDHEAARPLGRLARWVVLVVSFFAAVGQLQIAPRLIDTFFQGLTWTIVLVVGLSIGLGSKDLVARLFEDWYKRISK